MNCFEARQEFAALWRKTASEMRRAELLAHLRKCAKCDRAFRRFALSAPALHSDPPPRAAQSPAGVDREFPFGAPARRIASLPAHRAAPPRWMAIAAAAAIFLMSGVAAGLAAYAPGESIADAFSSADSAVAVPAAVADPFGLEQSDSAQVGGFAG